MSTTPLEFAIAADQRAIANQRSAAANLRKYAHNYAGDPYYPVALRQTLAAIDNRVQQAEERRARLLPWGDQFLHSAAWRDRTGYVTHGRASVDRYLEERAITGADLDGGELVIPGPSPLVAPIAARCDPRPASVGNATVIRWHGPQRPAAADEGQLKPGANLAPSLTPVSLPIVSYWVPVTRHVLDDHQQLAAIIDGRLRRGLGLDLDDRIAAALADDPDVATAGGPDLAGAIRNAVGALAANGYFGDVTVLVAPGDLAAAGSLADLPVLGVTAVIPTAGLTAGTAIAADLRAGVQVRYAGSAELLTTDSHAEQFIRNEITLLAEQRALGAVTDPAAAVRATADDTDGQRRARRV